MYEVKIYGENIGKYFGFYGNFNKNNGNLVYYLISSNEEMDEFINYISNYSVPGHAYIYEYVKSKDSNLYPDMKNNFGPNEILLIKKVTRNTIYK